RLDRNEQLVTIADDARLAILRRVMARPLTITQLGEMFGRHPAWIRHHILMLQRAGLVELAEERQVRNYTEKYYRASARAYRADVLIVPDAGDNPEVVVLGSHDLALQSLADVTAASGGPAVVPVAIGSLDGLIALRQGLADVAGCHLLDTDSDDYNAPYVRHLFPDRQVTMFTLAHREQGLITAPGNPLGLRSLDDVVAKRVRIANRNPGSGTRIWVDRKLRSLGIDPEDLPGSESVHYTHSGAARAVQRHEADVTVGLRAAATSRGLGFVPLFMERFDLVIAPDALDAPKLDPLLNMLEGRAFKKRVSAFDGYDPTHTGEEFRVAV
ncbi:MAG: substrate-binding domain-containing protein, partial [Coriobacteriales bacterium]